MFVAVEVLGWLYTLDRSGLDSETDFELPGVIMLGRNIDMAEVAVMWLNTNHRPTWVRVIVPT